MTIPQYIKLFVDICWIILGIVSVVMAIKTHRDNKKFYERLHR